MMTREFRDAWTAKLRSGEYIQGQQFLCDKNGRRCCLGVALDIKSVEPDGVDPDGTKTFDGFAGALSFDLIERIGITAEIMTECWKRNDGHGRDAETFPQIADYIDTLPVAP